MARKKHIITKLSYLCLTAFLLLIGYRTVETPPSLKQIENDRLFQEKKSMETALLLEKTNCPLNPEKEGLMIEYSENVTLPSDSDLENLKIYEVAELSEKKLKQTALEKGQILLGNYFSNASQRTDKFKTQLYTIWTHQIDFSDKGKAFHYSFSNGKFGSFTFTHYSHTPDFKEARTISMEQQYLNYDEGLLKKLQMGVWDGTQCHLKLRSAGNNIHIYQYDFDGKTTTNGYIMGMGQGSFHTEQPVTISYKDGYLSEINGINCFPTLNRIRDAKIKYTSIKEAITEWIEREKKNIKLSKFPRYYYYYITDVTISYLLITTGDFKRSYSYAPILDIKIKMCDYDLTKKLWSATDEIHHCAINLETGEIAWGNE